MQSRFSDELDRLESKTPDPLSTSSNPPSLKGRKPFTLPVSSLFGSKRSGVSNRGPIKVNEEIKAKHPNVIDSDPIINEKAVEATARAPTPNSAPEKSTPTMSPTITLRRQADPITAKPTRSQPSKSRTILRHFTTKRKARPPSARYSIIPVPPDTLAARENREAALRARGLLPPKDLSAQEQEQDRSLAVVSPFTDEDSVDASSDVHSDTSSTKKMTAAIQIKQEWEARNKNVDPAQRDRMNNFKFGGTSPSLSPVTPQLPELEPVAEVETSPCSSAIADSEGAAYFLSLPSPVDEPSTPLPLPNDVESAPSPAPDFTINVRSPPPSRALPPSPSNPTFASSIPLPPSPSAPSSSTSSSSSTPSKDGAQTPRPRALIINTRLAVDACSVPLPPSPGGAQTAGPNNANLAVEAHSIPLPPSPLDENTPTSPRSFKSAMSTETGSPTPKAFEGRARSHTTTALPVSAPKVYLTPPSSPQSAAPGSQGLLSVSTRNRSSSLPPLPSLIESESSMPSLCVDTASMSTSESSPTTSKGKMGTLKVRTMQEYGVNNIPIIVESPIEGESIFSEPIPNSAPADLDKSNHLVVESPLESEEQGDAETEESTDSIPPTKGMERKTSMNIFKRRGRTLDSSSTAPSSNRLSMSSSLSSIRRSVVGSLSRPKSSSPVKRRMPTTFNASHLPPSPTLPRSFTDPSGKSRYATSPGVGLRPRQPVGPMIYSRGSIHLQTNQIEDEESRKLTELAFLG